jgi:hypothetical protein
MQITYVLKTHNTQDFLVGSRELAKPTGAELLLQKEVKTGNMIFSHNVLKQGDMY